MTSAYIAKIAMISMICLSLSFGTSAFSQDETKPEETKQENSQEKAPKDKDPKAEKEKEPSKEKTKKSSSKKTKKRKSSKKKKNGRPGKIRGEIKAQEIGNSKSYCFFDKKGEMVQCGKVIRHKSKKEKYKLREFKKPSEERRYTPELGEPGGSSGGGARMWALYNPSLFAPVTYNNLGYADAEAQSTRDTLWSVKSPSNQAFFSFGMQVSIPLSKSISIIPGIRYRVMSSFEGDSNYDEAVITPEVDDEEGSRQQKIFARISQESSSLGFWVDAEYLRFKIFKGFSLFLTSGIDLDQSRVTFQAKRIDDFKEFTTAVIAEGTSETNILSLRSGFGIDYVFFGSFGLHTGVNLLIPIYNSDPKFEGEIEDFNTEFLLADPDEDLETHLGHKKSSFGLEITFGIVQEL